MSELTRDEGEMRLIIACVALHGLLAGGAMLAAEDTTRAAVETADALLEKLELGGAP